MLIAGNWKMFKGPGEARTFLEGFEAPPGVDVAFCPPFVSLAAAVETGDAETVGRAAHAVKGGSGSMGALRLAAVCAQVEAGVVAGGTDLAAAQQLLAAEVEQARAALVALYRP